MESFKIWVTNEKDRKKVLKKMSREGITWRNKKSAFEGDVHVGCPIGFFVHNGTLLYGNDYSYFIKKKIKEISLNEYLERDKNQNIIIIYRNGNKVIAKNKLTGTTVEAKCHPEDEFDFVIGAKLAFDRLIDEENKSKEPEYYNGKVVCVDKELVIRNGRHVTTKGKIYEFINGFSCYDNGERMPPYGNPVKSLEELNERLSSKFIEIVE